MKKVIFIPAFCFISLLAVSQSNQVEHESSTTPISQSNRKTPAKFDKGCFFFALSGSTSASNSYQDYGRNWSVAPQIGYFIANQLIGGFQFSMGNSFARLKSGVQPAGSRYEYSTYSYLPEVYLRYYLLKFRVKPFFQLSAGYNFHTGEKFPDGEFSPVNSRQLAYSGTFGVNFRIGNKFGIEALYNTRFDNYTVIYDANDILKYRLGFSMLIK